VGEMGNAYRNLVRKPKGKCLFGTPIDGTAILKLILQIKNWGLGWILMTQDKDQWWVLDELSDYQLLKKDFSPWSDILHWITLPRL
jgi:hypothetical protein